MPERRAFIGGGYTLDNPADLETLSEGRLIQRGSNILDSRTGRIRARISELRGAFIERGNRGTLLLSNYRSVGDVLGPRTLPSIPRAEISGTVSLPDGTLLEPVQRIVTLTPRDRVVYINDQATTSRQRYATFPRGIFGEQGPPLTNEFGRLATPEELLQRSIAGWLTRNASSFLDRAKLTGIQLPDGTITTSGSEIVRVVAASVRVNPIITYILSEGI